MLLSRREMSRLALLTSGLLANIIPDAKADIPLVPLTNTDFEPLGGQPPQGSAPSVADFDYQLKYQRALEAVIWAVPAIAIYRFRAAAMTNLGLKDNDIIAYSAPATPKLEAITANASTPYISAFCDLQQGPAVLEVPAASADGSLYGQVVDAWQFTIADVGPSGLDKGAGGKFLFTPPGYDGDIPGGYIHIASPNYRIAFAFRSVRAKGKTADDAYAYAKRLRMYFLKNAASPPAQKFFDPLHMRYPTLPFYDERHFTDLHDIVTVEPVKTQDKVMMGMLATLGIEKGKPFAPDAKTTKAMRQAAIDFWFLMQGYYDQFPKEQLFWPDRHYASLLQADTNKLFTWEYEDRIDLLPRAAEYYWCTYMPKQLSAKPARHIGSSFPRICRCSNSGL